jgi:hypothetical protein
MSNANLPALIEEISHEISRDGSGWYFTQRAAARLSGMDWKTIREGLQIDRPDWLGAGLGGSKMLKSIAAQGISPAGLEQFQQQWRDGRISDVLVSCLITYHATQKKGDKDPDVVALHGVLVAGGLRGLLDSAFNIEDVGGRVIARLHGIDARVKFTRAQAENHKNIGAYTAAITNAITGHTPKAWNTAILPGQFGDKAGRIRDHVDEVTIDLMKAAEAGMRGSNATIREATRFAQGIRELAERTLGYKGPELSPAKLTPRVTRQINDGKRYPLADGSTGEMPLIEDGRKRKELSEADSV